MNQRKTKKYMGYSGLLVILLIAIDQFTKWLAYGESIEVKCQFCNKAYEFSVEELKELRK